MQMKPRRSFLADEPYFETESFKLVMKENDRVHFLNKIIKSEKTYVFGIDLINELKYNPANKIGHNDIIDITMFLHTVHERELNRRLRNWLWKT